ncbi:meiosis-specific protein ASY3-like isoform X3 [Durio zibethinus]|uniref:Meiosis-specific protein ASY3-like isoform X3 n=1 Tax=Durio zibethinus TaxID=66656 RepID=A0A6P5ZY81_DURZI|nr:meiosis-specific protein ASY3-like isoform X3 [Durio zibethinus]
MEVDVRRSLREDRMSDCRSFGSNYRPSSQSRKISIGVMIDSLAKRNLGATKEDKGKQPNAERIKPSSEISTEGKNKMEVVTTSKRKQTEDTEQVKSPWITPKSLNKKFIAPDTASFAEETSNPRQKKHNAVKDLPVTYSVQFFSNQTLNAQNVGSGQNKFDGHKRKGRMDGNSQRMKEFNFANAKKVVGLDKEVLEEKADKTRNVQTETLKTKLHELLGTVSSPKSLRSSSQFHEVNANNLKPEISTDHMGDTVVKPRQNSDTIETDSENPDKTIKRPVTRSSTGKPVPAKVQPDKTKVGLSSKQKQQESIFSLGEGRFTKLDGAVNSGSTLSWRMTIQKKRSKIDPSKICFPEEDNTDEIKQSTYRSETPLPAENTSILGNKIESLPVSFSEKRRENFERVQEKDSFHSPVTNETSQQVNLENPTSPKNGDKQEDYDNISLRNFVYAQDDLQSPTLGFKTPILITSLSAMPKTAEIEQGACSPVPSDRGFTIRNFRIFRTFQTSRPVYNKSNAQAQSIEDAEKHTNSSLGNPMPAKEKNDAVNEHSEASSEDRCSESFEEGSPIIRRYDWAGIGESYWFQEPSEQDQEDELTRAITLFALALETFKWKMDSATRKKSTEILMSISEEIKSMLLNAESHIESDVGKLSTVSKTKRKRLETRLQEQQEQLKLIVEKFKEDIHHHLLDCNSILEGMEAHQNELKGIMKKQKASHQKLLMHAQEAAEIQLNNAERRMTAVHESAREKMLQLKHVIAECLRDNIN